MPDHEDEVADPAVLIADPAFRRGDRAVELRDLERVLADPAGWVAHHKSDHRDTST